MIGIKDIVSKLSPLRKSKSSPSAAPKDINPINVTVIVQSTSVSLAWYFRWSSGIIEWLAKSYGASDIQKRLRIGGVTWYESQKEQISVEKWDACPMSNLTKDDDHAQQEQTKGERIWQTLVDTSHFADKPSNQNVLLFVIDAKNPEMNELRSAIEWFSKQECLIDSSLLIIADRGSHESTTPDLTRISETLDLNTIWKNGKWRIYGTTKDYTTQLATAFDWLRSGSPFPKPYDLARLYLLQEYDRAHIVTLVDCDESRKTADLMQRVCLLNSDEFSTVMSYVGDECQRIVE